MFDFATLLAQTTAASGSPQTEYALAWALVGGLVFLGLLAVGVPRPRSEDLPDAKKREFKPKLTSTDKFTPRTNRRGTTSSQFQSAIQQNQQNQQK
jgi:hypothetical protein